MHPKFDEKDAEILKIRQALFEAHNTPQVGDFVDFADGKTHRISYIWDNDGLAQTSDESCGMSFYLDHGYATYSGGLFRGVSVYDLELSKEKRNGRFWFFHHDWAEAHNGVDCQIPCRVWKCELNSRK